MVRTIRGNAQGRLLEGGLGNAMHIPILHPDVITTKPDSLVILPSFLTWWCLDEILLNHHPKSDHTTLAHWRALVDV